MNLSYRLISAGVGIASGALAAFVPDIAAAQSNQRLIDLGRELFMNETFEGNGRTCASCHPPTNNFTIDPAFIATLPDDDPLFVAEFNPDLADLEDPELMRRFGLILENADGMDRPGVMRGVPHTLGLRVSMAVNPEGEEALTRADGSTVREATGWSGDGAPGNGSLHSFATGAVIQHFTKTMNRVAGQDFRLPTKAELDALEAFQLSLGRQEEIDLATMNFSDPDVQTGKDLFEGVGINRGCSFCHSNAGANDSDGFNRNFSTNVASLRNMEARQFDRSISGDGGFDVEPAFEVAGIGPKFRGNGSMNTPPLIEAADTGPFFHNNSAKTIEDAVRFYTTQTFDSEDPFQLNDRQTNQVAALLRALSALDNVRNVDLLARDAQRERGEQARETIAVVIADTNDAIEVLTSGPIDLYPEAVAVLDEAVALAEAARDADQTAARNSSLRQVRALMEDVPDLILQVAPEVADGDAAPAAEAQAEGNAPPPAELAASGG
jgi:cytochrome c peroxidase